MGWIVISIAFITITTAIIFLIAKMISDSQLKKARRNYDETKDESRKPESSSEFRRDKGTDFTESKPQPSTQPERRELFSNDLALDLREVKPEPGVSIGTKKPKNLIRRIFKAK